MYIVGIDPSLSSTGISIYKDGELKIFNYNNKKANYKWFKKTNDIINYNHHEYKINSEFSDGETEKIKVYDLVTDKLIKDIQDTIGDNEVKIYMEGYSYSSTGKIIDLVAFSTLIRFKLLKIPNSKLIIIPPSSLKKYVGEFVCEQDKKGVYRDETGKSAGSFDKKDMMISLLKFKMGNYPYMDYLKENKDELLSTKNIPKPFDDVNDAVILTYFGCISNDIKI